jgi:hypothetical protein
MSRVAERAITRVRQARDKRSFHRVAHGVLGTAPLRMAADGPLFLSMVCQRDLLMYLLAIKSLYVRIGSGTVAIINDGSLTSADLAILEHHIPRVDVFENKEIQVPPCPRADFFWERLVKIIELSHARYVIQLDADTLVLGEIPEVVECWLQNKSFLLGTGSGQKILPALKTAQIVQDMIKANGWSAITANLEAEASLDKLPGAVERSYVHASAGFAGFARGAFHLADLQWFSTKMSQILGSHRWREYGTEQIVSNYLLANAPGARVLPFPRYACFEPHLLASDYAFLHFLGPYRYQRKEYEQRAAEFISCYESLRPPTAS